MTRREAVTDTVLATAAVAAAAVFWVAGGAPAPGQDALWLTLLLALLTRVRFRAGPAFTHPAMLALVPLLLLAPAAVVPLLVIAAHVAAVSVQTLARRRGFIDPLLAPGDAGYALAPALLVALAPATDSVAGEALLVAGAVAAMCLSDAAISLLRYVHGARVTKALESSAWVYGVDALLAPIGFAAALATREVPAAPAVILPLAALLAFFAHERRTRAGHAATLQTVLQHASDLILVVEPGGRLKSVMGSATTVPGDGSLRDCVHPDDVAAVTAFLARGDGEAEWRLREADGSYRHVAGVAADLTGDPHVGGIVLTVRDDEARRALRHRATHDPLTGLANRALFQERTKAALRGGEAAVLYLDLDGFKPVNDRLGHAAGDEVLRLVARRLLACVRTTDTVARLGGDEFALVLEDPARAEEVAARVRAALVHPQRVGDESVTISASVGVAAGGEDAAALLAAADRAMYQAKHRARARAQAFAPAADASTGPDGVSPAAAAPSQ